MIKQLKIGAGDDFYSCAMQAKQLATNEGCIYEFKFNDKICRVNRETDIEGLYKDYLNSFGFGWDIVGPTRKEFT